MASGGAPAAFDWESAAPLKHAARRARIVRRLSMGHLTLIATRPLGRLRRMQSAGAERRLAAVLAADVVGYSRLMQADDQATLAALTARRRLFAERAAAHGGRVVNAPGDSILVEFPSVVAAVQCAVELQRELAALDAGVAEARRMRFRMGIHLGDVLVDGAGIYGDGVNIAARLESACEPGGVALSAAAYEQVRDKLPLPFVD